MPGRGPQTFKKRQKEQQRKERHLEKIAKRLKRKEEGSQEPEPGESVTGEFDASLEGHTTEEQVGEEKES